MSVVNYHQELDRQQPRHRVVPSVADYESDPDTARLYNFIYNLHGAMRAIGSVHNCVGIDYKQYIVDILTPENKAILLSLLDSAPSGDS